jgi:nucleoside-diphosphate-sugar epimerase
MQVEERVVGGKDLHGVALRYGFFYGPGTWFTDGGDIAVQVRERKCPITGSGQGVWSWVHVDDAAAATAAALECARRIQCQGEKGNGFRAQATGMAASG